MMLEKYSDAIRALKVHAVEEREENKIVAKYRNKTRDKARSALKHDARRSKPGCKASGRAKQIGR